MGRKMALGRLTGVVLGTERIKGVSTKSGEPVPYDFTNAKVLVADSDVTVVTLPRQDDYGSYPTLAGGAPIKGELVDYLVNFTPNGREVRGGVVSDFPLTESALVA